MKTINILIIFAVALSLAACGVSKKKYQATKMELDKVKKEKSALESELEKVATTKDELELTTEEKEKKIQEMQGTYDRLVKELQSEIDKGEIKITNLEGKLTLKLVEKILFGSGVAGVQDEGQSVLSRIGDKLKEIKDHNIRIEGHSDNVPVGKAIKDRYPTNWELSTARAINVKPKLKCPHS